jgi:hypothetical protein
MALSKQLQRIHEVIMTIKQQGGVFGRNPTFNNVTIEGQLTFDGDIDINSDLKVSGDIETTGNVIIGTSGNGIDFSATSDAPGATSELFDDYEEGVFTPTITSGAGSFSSITYDNARSGRYTKVGNLVHFQIRMRTDAISVGTASGAVVINGLPFTSANEQTSCSVYSQDMGGNSPIVGQVQNSDTVLVTYYYSGTSYVILNVTDLATGGNSNYMFITGTYIAA